VVCFINFTIYPLYSEVWQYVVSKYNLLLCVAIGDIGFVTGVKMWLGWRPFGPRVHLFFNIGHVLHVMLSKVA
jgi:hypothetical protein